MSSSPQVMPTGYTVEPIAGMAAVHDGIVRLAGAELGVASFGLQVLDLPPGFAHHPEHDHIEDGQEEVYVVLRGTAEAVVDGESVALDTERILRIAPGSRRRLQPGPHGARILAIGRPVDGPYDRPDHFRPAATS